MPGAKDRDRLDQQRLGFGRIASGKKPVNDSSYYCIGFDGIKATAGESGTPGSVYWTPKDIPAGDTYKKEIMGLGSDSSISDKSDSVFSIEDCNQ